MHPSRQPPGISTGGQFAATSKARSAVGLADNDTRTVSEDQVEDALRLCLDAALRSRAATARRGYGSPESTYLRGVATGLSTYAATHVNPQAVALTRSHLANTLCDTGEDRPYPPAEQALAAAKATILSAGLRPDDDATRLQTAVWLLSIAQSTGQYATRLGPFDQGRLDGMIDGAVRLARPDLDPTSETAQLMRDQITGAIFEGRAQEKELLAIAVGQETAAALGEGQEQ
jgi:hypothetical protein